MYDVANWMDKGSILPQRNTRQAYGNAAQRLEGVTFEVFNKSTYRVQMSFRANDSCNSLIERSSLFLLELEGCVDGDFARLAQNMISVVYVLAKL